ncbi:hypothetical protein [Comamonas terrigena]|nr:hypothetical protein [Comamonas terrigena]MDH0049653.1 hypothetical protein [Comamonas terrigena]MDH0511305.1 hypothetical protein [Comamonas terrigena]MDH1091392.1 hypothetical protein [Comamonas terrigena]
MKHHAPITLDGPYPKRTRRVARALRTWGFALVAVVVALLWHFTG